MPRMAGPTLPFSHFQRQFFPGSVHAQRIASAPSYLQLHALPFQPVRKALQHFFFADLPDLALAQRGEADHLVQPVQELPEGLVPAERTARSYPPRPAGRQSPAGGRRVSAPQVGGQNDHTALRKSALCPSASVRAPSSRICSSRFHTCPLAPSRSHQTAPRNRVLVRSVSWPPSLVAHIARRRTDEPGDTVPFGELRHIQPD